MAKWFICENDEVTGPFDTDVLETKIDDGSLHPGSLIWGHPQEQWRPQSWWKQNLSDLLGSHKQHKQDKQWHFVINDVSHGPVKRSELIDAIKDLVDKSEILVWTNGMDEWSPIFEVSDLQEDIEDILLALF